MISPRWAAPAGLVILLAGLFAPFLFAPDAPVLSAAKTDIAQHFLPIRSFAARELSAGNVPLWNPHLLAGTPFVGGFQSAVFYPPNLLYLVVPAARMINVSIVLHLLFAALALRAWARHHGIRDPAATLGGTLFILSGPLFARIHAGHLTMIEAAPWVVVTLLAVDLLLDGRGVRAVLLLALAIAMLVLVGHPQTAFFAGVAAAIYAALRLRSSGRPAHALAAAPIALAAGAALAAVQWWPAVAESSEAFRAEISRETAAGFSLPLDSLLTLAAPAYFGPLGGPYWGGSYPWEVSLFLGAGACFLAVWGAAGSVLRGKGALLATMAVLFVVALGANGPLFALLFEHVPGFDRFRAWSRFSLPLAMFASLFAAAGFQRLLDEGRPARRWAVGLAILALAGGGLGLLLRETGGGVVELWARATELLHGADTTNDVRLVPGDQPRIAGAALTRAAATMLGLAGTLAFVPTQRRLLVVAIALVTLFDPLANAWSSRGGFSATVARFDQVAEIVRGRGRGDERVMNTVLPNSALTNGTLEVRGYDPTVLLRTSDFHRQISAADDADYENISPLYALLRLGTVFAARGERVMSRPAREPPLPRLALFGEYEYAESREWLLRRLSDPGFDFRRSVLLERVPDPRPVAAGATGTARLVSESTDHLEVEATVPAPAVLLVTDAYHPFWTADGSYDVLPADGMLRAVPLEAGTHRIRLEYRVPGFGVARAVSGAAWLLWIVLAVRETRRSTRSPARHRPAASGGRRESPEPTSLPATR